MDLVETHERYSQNKGWGAIVGHPPKPAPLVPIHRAHFEGNFDYISGAGPYVWRSVETPVDIVQESIPLLVALSFQ